MPHRGEADDDIYDDEYEDDGSADDYEDEDDDGSEQGGAGVAAAGDADSDVGDIDEEEEDDEDEDEEDEDEVERKAMAERKYEDEIFFDHLRPFIPHAKLGSIGVLISVAIQATLVLFLFLGHHYERPDFDCCNAYMLVVCALFLIVQLFYFFDWNSIAGDDPGWHRSNLFVPLGLFFIAFLEWAVGTLSMLSGAIDIDLFDFGISSFSHLERASFVLCSVLLLVDAVGWLAVAWVHRNMLGEYYYKREENRNDAVELSTTITPLNGVFDIKYVITKLATLMRVETASKANERFHQLVLLAYLLQIPFYFFASLTYAGSDNQSTVPVAWLCAGFVVVVAEVKYVKGALTPKERVTRKWHRVHMLFPYGSIFALVATYFFTMSSVYLKRQDNSEVWEDILPELDSTEKFYFSMDLILICCLLVVHLGMSLFHRKGWCDGQLDLDAMLEIKKRRAEQRLLEQGVVAATGEDSNSKVAQAEGEDSKAGDDREQPPISRTNSDLTGSAFGGPKQRYKIDETATSTVSAAAPREATARTAAAAAAGEGAGGEEEEEEVDPEMVVEVVEM